MRTIDQDLTDEQIGLLLLIQRLTARQQPLERPALLYQAEIKLPRVAENYDSLCLSLIDLGLFKGSPEQLIPTPQGTSLVDRVGREHSLVSRFYDEYYRAVEHSPAHSRFCEKVYGKDLAQHGLADIEQIQILLDGIGLERGDSFLDFGCGSGRITEYIADTTSTRGAGIDKSPAAIVIASQRTAAKASQLSFYWADIDKGQGELPQQRFDQVIAIDSLFFAADQRLVLETLLGVLKPEGSLGIFYIDFEDQPPPETRLGRILADLGLAYSVRDLSSLNKAHWIEKKRVLQEMEEEFYREGSGFLFKNRMAECEGGLEDLKRYLFLIKGICHV